MECNFKTSFLYHKRSGTCKRTEKKTKMNDGGYVTIKGYRKECIEKLGLLAKFENRDGRMKTVIL